MAKDHLAYRKTLKEEDLIEIMQPSTEMHAEKYDISPMEHKQDSSDYEVLEPGKIRLSFKTQSADIDNAFVNFIIGTSKDYKKMKLKETKDNLNIYETVLEFKDQIEEFEYNFQVYFGRLKIGLFNNCNNYFIGKTGW
jgi:hypothetical protein